MLKTSFGIAFCILAFAYVSEQDFQIKSAEACEARGDSWSWDGEVCSKTNIERKGSVKWRLQ